MAESRVYTQEEYDFLERHPDIVFEGVEAVYYRNTPADMNAPDVERFVIYPILKRK